MYPHERAKGPDPAGGPGGAGDNRAHREDDHSVLGAAGQQLLVYIIPESMKKPSHA